MGELLLVLVGDAVDVLPLVLVGDAVVEDTQGLEVGLVDETEWDAQEDELAEDVPMESIGRLVVAREKEAGYGSAGVQTACEACSDKTESKLSVRQMQNERPSRGLFEQ